MRRLLLTLTKRRKRTAGGHVVWQLQGRRKLTERAVSRSQGDGEAEEDKAEAVLRHLREDEC